MAPTNLTGTDILVVEDNAINMFFVTHLLDKCGYAYRTAANGQEAVAAAALQAPALILMDIQMPVKDGLTATKEIREIERTSGERAIIIALTARAQNNDREQCLEAGMDDYLSKPIRAHELVAKIAHWLPAKAA